MQYLNVISGTAGRYLFFFIIAFTTSCTSTKNAPKGKYYFAENTVEKIDGNFTRAEKTALRSRLLNQLDDSAAVKVKTSFLFFHVLQQPAAFDTGYAGISARNMRASMIHLGYYNAKVNYRMDTTGKRVHVKYSVIAGKPTLIDTLTYRLRRSDLQQLAMQVKENTLLDKNDPVTKAGVLGEIGRLVDTFRNNGYYKFTASELRMRGDTTIEALTTVSDDPFEQLRLLAEAQQQRDSPKIRLALVLNPPADSSRLTKYYINKIFVLPDFFPGDVWSDSNVTQVNAKDFSVRYRQNLFRTSYLGKYLTMRSGDMYRQREFVNTVNNFSRTGQWRSVNARLWEVPGDTNKINLVVELLPARKYSAEASVEASYSPSNNTTSTLGGNLFGVSLNLGLTNRNLGKEGIRLVTGFRTGIELNNNSRGDVGNLVNSRDVSFSGSLNFPSFKLIKLKKWKGITYPETFINTSVGFNNRLALFNTQSANLSFGWRANVSHPEMLFGLLKKLSKSLVAQPWQVSFRPVNIDFSYLFNKTDSFNLILQKNPFLNYSYTTAFIPSAGFSLAQTYNNPKHLLSVSRERVIKINFEQTYPLKIKYVRNYTKMDVEYKYTVNYAKTALAFRLFTGVGIPANSDTNRSLPFFKQYFGGGSSSMRAWPLRGIGVGSQKPAAYGTTLFNNQTADIQFESNAEYRYIIAKIIPNTLTLRGAVFMDAGNIWNFRSSPDTINKQFKFSRFYKELGVDVGTGFRIDLNYFIVRLDLGFRIKRPELADVNNGWKLPNISFNDMFTKIFGRSDASKRWRYENFNFTFGISYPF